MHDESNGIYIGENGTVELTVNENTILYLLIKNKGRTTTFDEIAKEIYKSKSDKFLNMAINQMVFKLRKKLKNEFKIYGRYRLGYFIFG